MNFRDFFFNLLPDYYYNKDSYKDSNGEGLLQRLLSVPADYLEDVIKPKTEDYLINIYNLEEGQFIHNVAYQLGNISQEPFSNSQYKKLVENIIAIYKIKGTKLSYKYLFFLYNPLWEISLEEIIYTSTIRDKNTLRDTGGIRDTGCGNCNGYYIHISDNSNTPVIVNIDLYYKIKDLISLIEPLNIKLLGITYNNIPLVIENNLHIEELELNAIEELEVTLNGNPIINI